MNAQKELQALVDKQELCFLGSITEKGYPMIRAMLKPIKIDDNCLYLHTNTSSNKVQQFLANSKACVCEKFHWYIADWKDGGVIKRSG